ncbi:MAG: Glutathione transport system permease protein GsiC [Paracidovorax wautersii]|uniref:Glutathione transport system permease protein GsiC n=1 Tax=Paracidovorax wautersii TaxID=1177982 RepID=A0A7V8JR33_9BURK|nr:MAG: Glutathione transport system permease protein GsiC [Paracidovorax wautersii]
MPGSVSKRLLRLAQRLGLAALTVLGAATAAFAALRLVPVDPAFVIAGAGQGAVAITADVLNAIRVEYHLDQPLLVQYGLYLSRLLHGDLGMSYLQEQPVLDLIAEQAGPTLALAGLASLFAVALSLGAAVATAGRRGVSAVAGAIELVLASTPVFWIGFVLMLLLAVQWRVFPLLDAGDLRSLVLPALTLALPTAALLAQVLRRALEDVLEQPFILTARARGLSLAAVKLRHALRHAAIPYVTLLGFSFGALLSGAAVTETLFGRPGLGRLLVSAVTRQDMPLVLGLVIVGTVAFVIVNTLIDAAYILIDPRMQAPTPP